MFKTFIIYIFAFIIFLPTVCYSFDWHTSPNKWSEPRVFHSTFEDRYNEKIVITSTQITDEIKNYHYSNNKAYWFTLQEPDFMKSGQWSTIIEIFNERDYLINIQFVDHNQYCVKAKWINEKLIYIQVWWGRVLGSYLIYDVEKERVIIKEMLHDGNNPFQQYQQVRDKE